MPYGIVLGKFTFLVLPLRAERKHIMASYQSTIICGNLGSDPTEHTFQSGAKVVNFSVAVNDDYPDRNGNKVEHVEWFRCQAWNGTGKAVMDYKKAGDEVTVIGTIRQDPANAFDANGNELKGAKYTKLRARQVLFHGRGNGSRPEQAEAAPVLDSGDEIPF
jgi:single-stranded DNA-binding protein